MSTANQISTRPASAPPETKRSASGRLASSALWSLVGFSAAQVIRFASSLVLTRFLMPEDFGVMAVATAISVGVVLFSDLGTNLFLIQHKNAEDPRYFNTAWSVGIVRGILLWMATVLLGWPISIWYKVPILGWLIPALGFSLVISGFNSTAIPLLTRRIEPAKVVMLNVGTAFLGTLLSVLWVVLVQPSVWGLVVGNIGSNVAFLVLSHCVLPGHRNSWCWDREVFTELFRMSRWVLPSTIVTFFSEQADRLLVASLAGMSEVGLYHLAAQLCQLPLQLLGALGSNLLFPYFSEHVRNGGGSIGPIRRVRRLYLGFGTVMVLGLLLLGPTIAKLLFGSRFGEAGWIAQVLALSTAFRSLSSIGEEYLKALGKFQLFAMTNAIKVPIVFAVAPLLGVFFGTAGLLGGFVLADALRYAVIAYSLHRNGVSGFRDDVIALSIVGAAGVGVLVMS